MYKVGQVHLVIVFLGICCYSLVSGFTPEDVSFAVQRCSNISSSNSLLRNKWAYWNFPDKKETHCYVKCLLEQLGLIDLITRGLDPNKITAQFTEEDYASIQDYDFWDVVGEELSGTCKSYYTKWTNLWQQYPKIFERAFFTESKYVEAFFKARPYGAKRKGMTAIDFCVSTSRSDTENDLNVLVEEQRPCYWECVFKHFRYFDAYGRINRNEVTSDFRNHQNYVNGDLELINACVHRSNQEYPYGLCRMGNALYKCLIGQLSYTNEVFIKRDIWTASF